MEVQKYRNWNSGLNFDPGLAQALNKGTRRQAEKFTKFFKFHAD